MGADDSVSEEVDMQQQQTNSANHKRPVALKEEEINGSNGEATSVDDVISLGSQDTISDDSSNGGGGGGGSSNSTKFSNMKHHKSLMRYERALDCIQSTPFFFSFTSVQRSDGHVRYTILKKKYK